MRPASPASTRPEGSAAPGCTLLELVTRLTRAGGSVDQVVDTALALVNEGRVRLFGNFRDQRLSLD